MPLSNYFVEVLSANKSTRCQLSAQACQELQRRPWHGNVRELRNAIEHAVILARGGTIMPEHLPESAPSSVVPTPVSEVELAARIQSLLQQWTTEQLVDSPATDRLYNQLLAMVEPPVLQAVLDSQAGQLVASAHPRPASDDASQEAGPVPDGRVIHRVGDAKRYSSRGRLRQSLKVWYHNGSESLI